MEQIVKDEFARLFQSEGGFYDPESSKIPYLRETSNGLLAHIIDLFVGVSSLYDGVPEVHVALINCPALGGAVKVSGNKYYVGLYNGSIRLLLAYFNRMLASPNILTFIGNASEEIERDSGNPFIIDGITLIENIENYPDDYKPPHNPKRAYAAHNMMYCAMLYLALHELGHVFLGHFSYRREWQDINTSKETNKELFALELQAMEFDADSFAASHGTFSVLYPYEAMTNEERIEFDTPNDENILCIWVFSVFSMLSMLSLIPYNENKLRIASHPPAGMRIANIAQDIVDSLSIIRIRNKHKNAQFTKLSDKEIVDQTKHAINAWLQTCTISLKSIIADEEIHQMLTNSTLFNIGQKSHFEAILNTLISIKTKLHSCTYKFTQ